jgi:hypothetical protein
MKKRLIFGTLVCVVSAQAMDDSLKEEVAFFRAVAAGQLVVVAGNKVAFPGYESGSHVKTADEIKALYAIGVYDYMAVCERMNVFELTREDQVANWIFRMFGDFITDTDVDLSLSVLETKEPEMVSFLAEIFRDRLNGADDIDAEFGSIIRDVKTQRSNYRKALGSADIQLLKESLSSPINLFRNPLRAIAFDEKNKESGETLIPKEWSAPTESIVAILAQAQQAE